MYRLLRASFFLFFAVGSLQTFAQIGMGTSNPDKSAVLDLTGTNKGFLAPRMSAVQRIAIATPAKGLLVYDNDSSFFFYYDGAAWKSLKNIAIARVPIIFIVFILFC